MHVVVLALTIAAVIAHAQSDLRTSVTKEDARWNWYITMENVYDSAGVEYIVGEFSVNTASEATRVYVDLTVDEWLTEGASTATELVGRGTPLWHQERGRTRPFALPERGTLSFFRLWSAYRNGAMPAGEVSNVRTRSWADVRWTIGSGRLTDTMDVALWLVDARTSERIVTLDSVGMVDRPGQPIIARYGSAPDRAMHTVTLPHGMAGRMVEVRAIGYRRGATPAGLIARKRASEHNLSALYADEWTRPFPGNEPRWIDPAFADTISMVHLDQLTRAHEGARTATGCTPALLGFRSLPKDREAAYETMVTSLAADVYSPECLTARRADTTWWLNTLSR